MTPFANVLHGIADPEAWHQFYLGLQPVWPSGPPAPDAVWLFWLDLDDSRWGRFDEVLNAAEQARALRFVDAQQQQRYRHGRAALRLLLAACLQRDAQRLPLVQSAAGKPQLADGVLHFNVAHRAQRMLVAVAHDPVGVDLEWLHRPGQYWHTQAPAFCSAAEWQRWQELPDAIREDWLARLWTRKQAWCKAGGCEHGLSMPQVTLHDDHSAGHTRLEHGEQSWQLLDVTAPADCLAALCLAQPPLSLKQYLLAPVESMGRAASD